MTPRLLAALLLTGCAVLPPGRATVFPGQPETVATVWAAVYGRSDTPPAVLWVMPADLHCTDPASGYPGFRWAGWCMEGLTLEPTTVFVAYRPGEALSRAALRHEFAHAYMARDGRLDPFHDGPEWKPAGIVEQAQWALEALGL